MKTKSFLSILLLIVFGTFSSCDLFDEADDVSFDSTIPLTFVINETAQNPEGMTYSDSELLDVTSDPDVAEYASKIKEIKVKRVTYTISPATLCQGESIPDGLSV